MKLEIQNNILELLPAACGLCENRVGKVSAVDYISGNQAETIKIDLP